LASQLPNLADPIVRRWLAFLAVSVVLLAGVVGFAGAVAERRATADLARQAQASATLHAAVLRSELAKHRSLPFVLAQDPDVAETLRSAEPRGVDALNRKLETLSGGTRAAVIYVLNAKGMTIAASNWREPTSFVGSDYSFRPYFNDGADQGRRRTVRPGHGQPPPRPLHVASDRWSRRACWASSS
jgi:two-component system C4-dicarboxylate transport sensor histidine kinase DctB